MLQVIDTREQSIPNWDYINKSLLEKYPIITYYFPNKNHCIYLVKCITKDTTYSDGYIYIMSDKDLPHQGKCLNRFLINNSRITDYIHYPTYDELNRYHQTGLAPIQYCWDSSGSFCGWRDITISNVM